MLYAIYNQKMYDLWTKEGFSIFTEIEEKTDDSFQRKYNHDISGSKSSPLYIKKINEKDIELVFELDQHILYKGIELEIEGILNFETVGETYITIRTTDDKVANKLGFSEKDFFSYKKGIRLDEVDGIIEIRRPALYFSHLPEQRNVIRKKDIKRYLELIG